MERLLMVALMMLCMTGAVGRADDAIPWTELQRVPIPEELPPHPRVFCTQADLDRIRADYEAGDAYTRVCVEEILRVGEQALNLEIDRDVTPGRTHISRAAQLAEAWAVSGDERFGVAALQRLRWFADVCPTLETTRSRGRFASSTLTEGPVARDLAMAYDLVAAAPFTTDADREHIEQDLLRIVGWECGHRCGHKDSSNWRSWALAILASCGFAAGDRELIDEAINGAWDPERERFLYGIVQQITHSIFADGIHWERSMGYTYYTASALQLVLVAAENSGIDLWRAELQGLLQPIEGGAPHDEFGPPGARSVKYMLDAPFYYGFPDLSFARISDSGTGYLRYHPIYENAWTHYRDPKYAWLITRQRERDDDAPGYWHLWRPSGEPEFALSDDARTGVVGCRLTTDENERVALVQNVSVPADRPVTVSGWVKALSMDGGSAHIRCNWGGEAVFTDRVREAGDWTLVQCTVPPDEGAEPGQMRSVRLHVFLENGAGDVVWDDIFATAGGNGVNVVRGPSFETRSADGRATGFWSLVHSPRDVPEGHFTLAEDATIGLAGVHTNGSTNFPVGGFTILRADATDEAATAVNVTWGPYGSGHDHPDRLAMVVYGQGRILCPDAGSWGYDDSMHLTWANQTIAHNTLTVDEVAQSPQGTSDSIWANGPVTGRQHLFHPGEYLRAGRFTCDTAYEGVTLDRTVCVVGDYLLDVFRARSAQGHLYDLALHARGELDLTPPLGPAPEGWSTARGYEHLTDVRWAMAEGLVRGVFDDGGASLLVLHRPPDSAAVIAADEPVQGDDPQTAFISRARAASATWVTVLEPFVDEPAVRELTVEPVAGGLRAVVEHAGGRDEITVPDDPDGALELLRMDAEGDVTATERAEAATNM